MARKRTKAATQEFYGEAPEVSVDSVMGTSAVIETENRLFRSGIQIHQLRQRLKNEGANPSYARLLASARNMTRMALTPMPAGRPPSGFNRFKPAPFRYVKSQRVLDEERAFHDRVEAIRADMVGKLV